MGVSTMFGRISILFVMGWCMMAMGNVYAQGITFLVKGKVIDQKRNILQGVQVYAKDGDEIVGKSKTTVSGEFTMTLKPGKKYLMSFERSDVFIAQQDFQLPNGNAYKEIMQDFQVKVMAIGDTLQKLTVFASGQSSSNSSALFTSIPEMLNKMQHLKIKILVAGGTSGSKGKKESSAKGKGKKGSTSVALTLYEKRIQDIRTKLIAAGAPESRISFQEGKLKSPTDVIVVISSIAGGF